MGRSSAGYDANGSATYPTVYWTHGFGGTLARARSFGFLIYQRMAEHKMPPMIWVMLDESCATGTHEFANSLNNGPWGTALTAEFIPYLEKKYRMDARVSGRFLQGHSSGGWATLQLQVNYPTNLRRHLVDLSRSERLPQLQRHRPLRASR